MQEEVSQCPEPKSSALSEGLKQIEYTVIPVDNQVLSVAQKIIDMGILKEKSFDDCQHIAALDIMTIKNSLIPVAESFGIKKVYLFGSYATGTATKDSDIDLLIEKGGLFHC